MRKFKISKNIFLYETVIIVGSLMTILTLIKLLGFIEFSSDWFWFIAGLGLTMEGIISLIKQRMFDKKYKVVLRADFKSKK